MDIYLYTKTEHRMNMKKKLTKSVVAVSLGNIRCCQIKLFLGSSPLISMHVAFIYRVLQEKSEKQQLVRV